MVPRPEPRVVERALLQALVLLRAGAALAVVLKGERRRKCHTSRAAEPRVIYRRHDHACRPVRQCLMHSHMSWPGDVGGQERGKLDMEARGRGQLHMHLHGVAIRAGLALPCHTARGCACVPCVTIGTYYAPVSRCAMCSCKYKTGCHSS